MNINLIIFFLITIILLFLLYFQLNIIKNNEGLINNSFELDKLTVYQSPYNKIRIGNDKGDGGYIIADVTNPNYNILISGGINDDISFEDEFMNKYKNVTTYAFDGTIDKIPSSSNYINFIKKNIGYENNDNITNIHDIINKNDNFFVKMDIEGGEVDWVFSLNDSQINKFEQIVIEFHSPFTEKEIEMFDKLNKNHYLIHFHPNNCGGTRPYKGIEKFPNVFECTFLNKKYFDKEPKLSIEPIPGSLDLINCPNDNDIFINYAPFTN